MTEALSQSIVQHRHPAHNITSRPSVTSPPCQERSPMYLAKTDDAFLKRQTLANASLTCRVFLEPASRALWNVIHVGIAPLLRTFANLTVEKITTTRYPGRPRATIKIYWIPGGNIPEAEWERFDQLAARIRCVLFDYDCVFTSIVPILAAHQRARVVPLLPNLRILQWSEARGDIEKHQLLDLLCSTPNLEVKSLPISIYTWRYSETNVNNELTIIANAIPRLAHLRIDNYRMRTDGLGPQNPLYKLRHLRSLRLLVVTDEFYRHLSTLTCLGELETSLLSAEKIAPLQERRFSSPFSVLHTLGGHFEDAMRPPEIMRMLSFVASSQILSSLSLPIQVRRTVDTISCLTDIGSALSTVHTLQKLRVLVCVEAPAITAGNPTDQMKIGFGDIARTFLHLRSLEDVDLRVRTRAFSLSNKDTGTIQAAWPRLARLAVAFDAGAKHWEPMLQDVAVIRPSLLALVSLAEALPALAELDVEVADVTEANLVRLEAKAKARAISPNSSPCPALRRLALARDEYPSRVRLPDVERLAGALRRLLPRLRGGLGNGYGRRTYYRPSTGHQDKETDVSRLLKMLDEDS